MEGERAPAVRKGRASLVGWLGRVGVIACHCLPLSFMNLFAKYLVSLDSLFSSISITPCGLSRLVLSLLICVLNGYVTHMCDDLLRDTLGSLPAYPKQC